LTVTRELTPDLPKLSKFVSPAAGEWRPDLDKYPPALGRQVKEALGNA
jgi:hypothetical protein